MMEPRPRLDDTAPGRLGSAPADPIVIAALPAPRAAAELAGLERDVVDLTARERRRPRQDVTTRAGRALTLRLRPGEVAAPGCLIHVGHAWFVEVEAAAEPVLVLSPISARDEIRVALEVGRHHAALALDGDRLLVPDEPAMERLLGRLGVTWARERRPFIPISTGTPH